MNNFEEAIQTQNWNLLRQLFRKWSNIRRHQLSLTNRVQFVEAERESLRLATAKGKSIRHEQLYFENK